jgi:Fur family ferric uptake transcriptional regulator
MTAEEVLEIVRQKTKAVNITTVYRTLDLLVEKGLATRTDLGEGRVVYATAQHGPHAHLVCLHCGRVIEADASLLTPLGETIRSRYGFTPNLEHIALYGVCEGCETEYGIRDA